MHHSMETLNFFITDILYWKQCIKSILLHCYRLQDVSKSFDSTEHSILFAKLRTLGISKSSLEWFKSYPSDRRQSVRLASQRSESRTIMPSILGLILFSIYINDLPRTPSSSSLEFFVDDSKVGTVYFIRL
jgi:hypothetical protein